jgi:hypothetical protein
VVEIRGAGKIPAGRTEIPFEFPLKAKAGLELYETYHGVFVNIQYLLRCDMKRGAFSKDLQKTSEFIVEGRQAPAALKRVPFKVAPSFFVCLQQPPLLTSHPFSPQFTPATLQNTKDRSRKIPDFMVEGHLDSAVCSITEPFSGEVRRVSPLPKYRPGS